MEDTVRCRMRNKKHFEGLQMGYNKVPSQINQVKLTLGAYGLFHFLISLPEEADLGKQTIANKFNVTRQTVAKWYKELEGHNIIKSYSKGGLNRLTKYEFVSPKNWKAIT